MNQYVRHKSGQGEVFLTRDYINLAVKMREIGQRLNHEKKMRGWRLVMVLAVALLGSWAAVWAVIYGAAWVLQ